MRLLEHPILSILALLSIWVFVKLFILPRLRMRIITFRLRRIAKKHSSPLKEQLIELADGIDELIRDGEFDKI